MELKCRNILRLAMLLTRFNRTFMELKYIKAKAEYVNEVFQSYLYGIEIGSSLARSVPGASFNRTFMELKLKYTATRTMLGRSFNRTFMELKYVTIKITAAKQGVSIVPLWN